MSRHTTTLLATVLAAFSTIAITASAASAGPYHDRDRHYEHGNHHEGRHWNRFQFGRYFDRDFHGPRFRQHHHRRHHHHHHDHDRRGYGHHG